jgi:hypothetical protein
MATMRGGLSFSAIPGPAAPGAVSWASTALTAPAQNATTPNGIPNLIASLRVMVCLPVVCLFLDDVFGLTK